MKSIPIINQQLEKILIDFKNELFKDPSKLDFKKSENAHKGYDYFCSTELLNELKKQPISVEKTIECWMFNVTTSPLNELTLQLNEKLAEWDNQQDYLVVRPKFVTLKRKMFEINALSAVYPADGYLSWHTNADASGYNVLLTWSENGNGFFRYQDPATKEIVTMQDKPGWTCKAGYFGDRKEKDKIFWHCCASDELRITVAWIFPTLEASLSFQNKIQQP